MNKLKRLLFPIATVVARNDGDYLKLTSCSKIFTVGSLRRIHGKITTLPAGRGTAGRARGSFKVERSRSGRNRGRAPFCGSMGNVSAAQRLLLQRLMAFLFRSWRFL